MTKNEEMKRLTDSAKKYLNAKNDSELVAIIAKEMKNKEVSMDELMAAGIKGIAKAHEHYDESRGFIFQAYAVWWIRQAMQQAIAEKNKGK